MTWRDQLMPATLDGVAFEYRQVQDTAGRRTALFEYPGGEEPYIEDLGPHAKQWRLEAFLIGENYHVTLQELEDVLNTPGVRKFNHPYRGELPAKLLGKYTTTHSDQEGGMVKISFTLVEAGQGFPLIAVDTPAKVGILSGLAIKALEDKTRFSLLGAIKDLIGAVLGALGKALSAINKVNGKIAAGLSVIDDAAFLVDSIGDGLTELLNTPGALMNKLNNLLDKVLSLVTDFLPGTAEIDVVEPVFPQADILMDAFAELFVIEAEASVIPTATEQAELEVAAMAAITLNIKGATLALTSAAVADLELDSATQAAQVQETLAAGYDEVLASPDMDPEIFEIFAALKAATVEHLSTAQRNLPTLASYLPRQTLPALVVAYEVHGDARREAEIVRRNNVKHPAFLGGGIALEVVADD